MIVFVNPRATRPKNRRFPLSVMMVGAALPPHIHWEIVDGNLPDIDVVATVGAMIEARAGSADPVELIAMTVMPGPQLVSAVAAAKAHQAAPPGRADRVGRQFRQPLSRPGAQRAVTSTG